MEQTTLWSSNLGNSLWELPGFSSSAEYLEAGFNKCLGKFQHVLTLVNDDKADYDPCELIGEGWDAEDAFAVGLYCFLLNPDDPESVVQRSAFSNGPSDILAAVAGALAGAYNGTEGWPGDWLSKIEYKDEILELSRIAGRR